MSKMGLQLFLITAPAPGPGKIGSIGSHGVPSCLLVFLLYSRAGRFASRNIGRGGRGRACPARCSPVNAHPPYTAGPYICGPCCAVKHYAFTSVFSSSTFAVKSTTASQPAHASKNGSTFPASTSVLWLAFMPCCIRQ